MYQMPHIICYSVGKLLDEGYNFAPELQRPNGGPAE